MTDTRSMSRIFEFDVPGSPFDKYSKAFSYLSCQHSRPVDLGFSTSTHSLEHGRLILPDRDVYLTKITKSCSSAATNSMDGPISAMIASPFSLSTSFVSLTPV